MEKIRNKFLVLKNLSSNDKPLWGKMTAQHMVEHLIYTFEGSTGVREFECFSPEDKLPKLKRILLSNRPLPKLFITPLLGEKLMELKFDSFEVAVSELEKQLESFETYFAQNPEATPINPTFGKLNKEEWIRFHHKHVDHHFSQFGLL